MDQDIEIEYKNLLTHDEYQCLLAEFKSDPQTEDWVQANYYFDSQPLELKDQHAALRIRIYDEQAAEITLKIPHGQHLMEYNQSISYSEGKRWVEDGVIILPLDMQQIVEQMGIDPNALIYQCFMTTHRHQITYPDYQVVLDLSEYNQAADYELEVEADTDLKAKQVFNQLLESYHIPKRPSPSKIARAFQYMEAEQD